jgi:hypothetical protein
VATGVIAKTLTIMNTTLGPFQTCDFGKQVIQSAGVFWDVLAKDRELRSNYHSDICFDQRLDEESVEALLLE